MQQQCECKIEGNMNVQIMGICLNEECSEEWFCQNCVGNHDGHKNDLKIGDQMDQLLVDFNSVDNQKLVEADEKFMKLQEYYDRVLQENKNEIKMLEDLQIYIKQENFEEISKYLNQFKHYKQQIDNNKPAQIFKEFDRHLNGLKELDFSGLLDDETARKNKAKIREDLIQAKQLFDAQKFNDALQILEHSLEINNECVEAILLKIQILIQLEIFEDAITYCNQIIKINRQNFEVYFLKIITFLLVSKYDNAFDELKKVHQISSYRFYFMILNLIQEIEETSKGVKTTTQSLAFDLKKQLQSFITFQEISPQMLTQQITIIIQIIKLAEKNELQKALFQFNQNLQVIEDYQKQQDVDLRPKIDPKQWQEIVDYLEFKCKKQDNPNNNQQPSDSFQAQFNNFIGDTPAIITIDQQTQQQNQDITPQTQRDLVNFLNDTIQPQDAPNSQQQQQQNNKSQTQITQDKPHAKLQERLADFYNDTPQNNSDKSQQNVGQQTNNKQGSILEDFTNFCNEQSNGGKGMNVKLDEVNRLKEVLNYTDQLILQKQNVPQNYYKKAMILIRLNQLEQALQFIDQAISLDNKDANYYYHKALLLISLGQLLQALQSFDYAIERNPSCACYYYEKGKALQKLNLQDEAAIQFELATQKEKEDI